MFQRKTDKTTEKKLRFGKLNIGATFTIRSEKTIQSELHLYYTNVIKKIKNRVIMGLKDLLYGRHETLWQFPKPNIELKLRS